MKKCCLITETVTYTVNGTNILTTGYTYDAMNRLKSVTNKNSTQATLSSFAYTLYANGQRKVAIRSVICASRTLRLSAFSCESPFVKLIAFLILSTAFVNLPIAR